MTDRKLPHINSTLKLTVMETDTGDGNVAGPLLSAPVLTGSEVG